MSVSGPPCASPNEGFHPQDDTAENRDRPSTSQEDQRPSSSTEEGAVSLDASERTAAAGNEEENRQ